MRYLATATLLGAAGVLASDAKGDALPDWAEEIAKATPPVPSSIQDEDQRALLKDFRFSVESNGSIRVKYRHAYQVLSARAGGTWRGTLPFSADSRVIVARAFNLPPDERAISSWGAAVEEKAGSAFASDRLNRVVTVEGVRRGSLLFFEYEVTRKLRTLAWNVEIGDSAPIARARVSVSIPSGWNLRWAWARGGMVEPTSEERMKTWELRDLPYVRKEGLDLTYEDRAPVLALSVTPPVGASGLPPAFADWGAVSAWYEERWREPTQPAQSIAELGRSLKSAEGFWPTVKAATLFVRNKVRFLEEKPMPEEDRPTAPERTLQDLHGSSRDKAALLRAILSANGLASHPLLVDRVARGTISESVPVIDPFDHALLAIPIPGNTAVPEEASAAIVSTEDLGRLLLIDPFYEILSPGAFPWYLEGKKGLLIAGASGRLMSLAAATPAAHRIERRARFEVAADRSVSVHLEWRSRGQAAADVRSQLVKSTDERRKIIEKRVRDNWHDAVVGKYSAEPETADGWCVETIELTMPPSPPGGLRRVALFPSTEDDLARVSLGRRQGAVHYIVPISCFYESKVTGLPDTARIPATQERSGEGWSVRSSASRDGGDLTFSWSLELTRDRFDPGQFADLKKLWAAVNDASEGSFSQGP